MVINGLPENGNVHDRQADLSQAEKTQLQHY
jgi:hypothetical protein